MNKDDCVIYEGEHFRVEWFYNEKGESQAYDYFVACSDVQKRKFLILVKKLADFGTIYDITKFRNEGNDIYAFKPQPDRYLCFFFTGKKVIVTNAFRKKSDKLPAGEKAIAIRNRAIYIATENANTVDEEK